MTATDPSVRTYHDRRSRWQSSVSPLTGAPDDRWAALRRVHFFINDQIMVVLERMGVSVLDRRLLDALGYSESRGFGEGLPVATICDLVPSSPKPQTALSALGRMAADDRVWVEQLEESSEGRRGKRWRLTEAGRLVRFDYQHLAETIFREVYSEANEEQEGVLLAHGEAAMRFMDAELGPLVDSLEPAALGGGKPRTNWAALRGTHFYLNDLIFERAQKLGVDVVDRRILDSLSFAASRGAEGGITIAVLCALISPPLRHGLAQTALERMARLGWSERTPGSIQVQDRWQLTERGRRVRADYTSFAERQIGSVYAEATRNDLVSSMAAAAESHRVGRLEPILRHRIP